jgi:hypothetical protein
MWVKARKVGPGKRERWHDGPQTMGERERLRRERVQELLRERLTKYCAAIGSAAGRGRACGKTS